MLEDEIVIMNVERYIEVYSNETDELLYSYKITIPDHLVIEIVSPESGYMKKMQIHHPHQVKLSQ